MAKKFVKGDIVEGQRYLLYDCDKKHGLRHCRSNLCCLLFEALLLRRIAVIPNLNLNPWHNFGVPVPRDPERYFTLPPQRAGSDRQQQTRWIRLGEFEPGLQRTASSEIKRIGGGEGHFLSREDDQRYSVIVRELNSTTPFRKLVKNWRGFLPETPMDLPPSKEVESLSEEILQSMGLAARGAALSDKTGRRPAPTDDGFYACLHLRWGDRRHDYGFVMRLFLTPMAIRWRLNRIAGLPRGRHLYIMSDRWGRGLFDCLEQDYRVWRYYDFPQLRSLAPDTEGGGQDRSQFDSFFLLAVEMELMRRAAVRIYTEKRMWQMSQERADEKSVIQYWLFYRPAFYVSMQKKWRKLVSIISKRIL